ncbi:hypothetical protein PBY51_008868 [Eleginops maclovinus]|uniref:Uncharacterized protein n=1 Tax=Eleginops maclovinus TaxID=56733 RepID=A0AAN8AAV7_ELEMC|nr:hypothetical protein PBY51_008868 [Eleginops maclovinus]
MWKLPFPTQPAIQGDILEEAIQTASNEFLTTSAKEKEGGKQRAARETPAECITVICGLTFERGARGHPPQIIGVLSVLGGWASRHCIAGQMMFEMF